MLALSLITVEALEVVSLAHLLKRYESRARCKGGAEPVELAHGPQRTGPGRGA